VAGKSTCSKPRWQRKAKRGTIIPIKRITKAIFATLGYDIVRSSYADDVRSSYSDDFDAFKQQRRLLSDVPSPVIFDVGAHRAETSRIYAELFPNAVIHALEPFPESFEALVRNTFHLPQVTAHPIGLAQANRDMELNANVFTPTNSLLETHELASEVWGMGLLDTQARVVCKFMTLDAFLAENHINHVNLLKLDVQGAEYKVFEGGKNAFAEGMLDVIYMEIITLPTYKQQWQLAKYLEFLGDKDFQLHGIYNLSCISGQLRQIDAIFVRNGFTSPIPLKHA
jgi:FkbM family methyltransferase